jgi:hypothetical protein
VPESSTASTAAGLRNEHDLSAFAPLRWPVFRMLWFTWLAPVVARFLLGN